MGWAHRRRRGSSRTWRKLRRLQLSRLPRSSWPIRSRAKIFARANRPTQFGSDFVSQFYVSCESRPTPQHSPSRVGGANRQWVKSTAQRRRARYPPRPVPAQRHGRPGPRPAGTRQAPGSLSAPAASPVLRQPQRSRRTVARSHRRGRPRRVGKIARNRCEREPPPDLPPPAPQPYHTKLYAIRGALALPLMAYSFVRGVVLNFQNPSQVKRPCQLFQMAQKRPRSDGTHQCGARSYANITRWFWPLRPLARRPRSHRIGRRA